LACRFNSFLAHHWKERKNWRLLAGQLGAHWIPNTLDPATQTRSYARTAHYDPVKNRPNLHLLPGTKVTQITFRGNTATGVKVRLFPSVFTVTHHFIHSFFVS
jgi:choline dehydrogenase-like flavoprotein